MPGFTIPNTPDTAYTDQTEPDAVDFQILGDHRFGTISGGDVIGFGSPAMGVAVSSWVGIVNDALIAINGANVTLDVASANARFDLIVARSDGTFGVIKGTASATNPVFPLWPKTSAPLAAIYISSGTAGIISAMIVPKHIMVPRAYIAQVVTATNVAFSTGVGSSTAFTIDGRGLQKWESTPTDLQLGKATDTQLGIVGALLTQAVDAAVAVLSVKGTTAQTAALAEFKNISDTVLASIGADGRISSPNLSKGAAAPEGIVSGIPGDLYFQTGGSVGTYETRLWIKMTGTGNVGWKSMVVYDVATAGGVPPGVEMSWPSQMAPPAGWLECNGQAISRSTYATLFTLLGSGTVYGPGDGSTTFNLPDRTRRVLVGRDIVTTGFVSVGDSGGAFAVTLTLDQLPTHTHTVNQSASVHSHAGGTLTPGGAHSHGLNDPGHRHALVLRYHSAHNDQHPYATNASLWHFDYGNSSSATTGITINTAPDHGHGVSLPSDTHGHNVVVQNAGAGGLVDITPRYIVTRWIIKA